MKANKIKLSALQLNDANPRLIKDYKFQKLVKSILTFPEMMNLREIVTDETMTVLGGNMRLRALQHIAQMTEQELSQQLQQFNAEQHEGYWLAWHDAPTADVKIAEGLSDEQKQEFIIKDNVGYGEWDWDALANEWDVDALSDWGVDVPIDWSKQDVRFELPEELQGIDITPERLDKIEGLDETLTERVIITYKKAEENKVKELLGIESIEKIIYNINEIYELNSNNNGD